MRQARTRKRRTRRVKRTRKRKQRRWRTNRKTRTKEPIPTKSDEEADRRIDELIRQEEDCGKARRGQKKVVK